MDRTKDVKKVVLAYSGGHRHLGISLKWLQNPIGAEAGRSTFTPTRQAAKSWHRPRKNGEMLGIPDKNNLYRRCTRGILLYLLLPVPPICCLCKRYLLAPIARPLISKRCGNCPQPALTPSPRLHARQRQIVSKLSPMRSNPDIQKIMRHGATVRSKSRHHLIREFVTESTRSGAKDKRRSPVLGPTPILLHSSFRGQGSGRSAVEAPRI